MARRKITPVDETVQGLPRLTGKLLQYVLCRSQGMSQCDADRAVWGTSRKDSSIYSHASITEHRPDVSAWLRHAMRQGAMRAELTVESHLTELACLRDEAKASGNYGAAVQAEQLRGKVAGYYIERHMDVTAHRQADVEALQILQRLLGHEAADSVASRLGIELQQPAPKLDS